MMDELREAFIRRMTVDSDHHDRRRKDFNQAIFDYWSDNEAKDPRDTYLVWSDLTMDMVLRCFDDAVKDVRGAKNGRKVVSV